MPQAVSPVRKAILERAGILADKVERAIQEGNTHCDGELKVSIADRRLIGGATTVVEKFKA